MINWQLSKRVSADQYHLTVPRLKCRPIEVEYFWRYPLTNYQFQMIAGSSLFFPMINTKYVGFMSLWPRTIKILISNWSRTRVGHAVRQFLCSDWSKFDRWVHAENLCSILKVVYFAGVYMTPGRLSPGASSLRFPLMGLCLFTWYHHKMSRGQESPRREFTPVLVPGREFHSGTKSPNSIMY